MKKSKHVLAGLVAAVVVSSASASVNQTVVNEKQAHADIVLKMLGNISTVAMMPQCTVKNI